MIGGRLVAPCLALALLAGCEIEPEAGETGFTLAGDLSEISGLAAAGENSVFTHNDEHAIVYEIDLRTGRELRVFAIGDPTIEGDFEGIATSGGRVFLITSDGLIYSAVPGEHGSRVEYDVYDSGIGPRCEIEGLSQAPNEGNLLLLCKRLRDAGDASRLEIYSWRIGAERAHEEPWLSLALPELLDEDEIPEFQPSGLELDPVEGLLLVVSARNGIVLTLDLQGNLVSKQRLNERRHPKTEGIAITPKRRLILADEGSQTRAGRIAVYPLPSRSPR